MDYTNGYGYEDDYLDDDDDGLMFCTKDLSSDSDEGNNQEGDCISSFLKMKKKSLKAISSKEDNEDDFEREMSAELSETMQKLTAPLFGEGSSKGQAAIKSKEPKNKEFYDDIYFDTDESEDDDIETPSISKSKKHKRRILTDDDLLYDPNMDQEDQDWVDQRRRSYQMKKSLKKTNGPKPLPQSDAVLNCPACFTTLCLDCQRHEIYKEQYRAMFVFNCVTDTSEILHFTKKENKKKSKNKNFLQEIAALQSPPVDNDQNSTLVEASSSTKKVSFDDQPMVLGGGSSCEEVKTEVRCINEPLLKNEDDFHPVKCSVCNSKVAVQDKDEVYHFFNVITSY